jgi:hypothetical protein
MYNKSGTRNAVLLSIIVVIVLLASACASPAPVPATAAASSQAPATAPVMAAVLSPTPTIAAPTATLQPTATLPPTATVIPPSATPIPPMAAAENGFNAWCVPENALVSTDEAAKPWVMPAKARGVAVVAQKSTLYYDARSCVFEIAFNQPSQPGTQLEFYDGLGKVPTPWLKVDMAASPDNPNLAYAVVTHGMVTKPQLWWVFYTIVVRSPDGKEQFRQDIKFMRSWQVPRCWNGTMPNPTTLQCPKTAWGDIHPNDPGYGWYSKYGPSATPNP